MAGIDANTMLYLRGDSFVDLSLYNYTITNSSSIATTDSTHFGKAIDFTVASKRLEATSAVLPTDKFTIDWWELSKGASTANTALVTTLDNTHTNTAIKGIIMGKSSASAAPCLWATTPSQTGTWIVSQKVLGNANTTDWIHRALVYDGSNFYAYENGVLFNTFACAGLAAPSPSHIIMGGYRAQPACYNAHVESLRISNNIRWTTNFTPPTKPYTTVAVNILGCADNTLNFAATKQSVNEAVTRVDILKDNTVIKSFTSNFDNMTYAMNTNSVVEEIEIRAYYYKDYYESKLYKMVREVEKLEEGASLTKIVSKINELKNYYAEINGNLINFLSEKGVDIAENERTLGVLISKLESYSLEASSGRIELDAQKELLEGQIAELNAQITPLNSQISTLNSEISSLNSQKTSLNNELKSIASTLATKISGCGVSASSSESVASLTGKIGAAITKGAENGTGGGYGPAYGSSGSDFSYTVSAVSGSTYDFSLSSSGTYSGYYINDNISDSQYALCKVTVSNPNYLDLYVDWIVSSESSYDYGYFSTRGATFSASTSSESSYLVKSAGSKNGTTSLNMTSYSSGVFYAKYTKDGSSSSGNDTFAFKITT